MALFGRKKKEKKQKASDLEVEATVVVDEVTLAARQAKIQQLFELRQGLYTKFYEYVDRMEDYFYGHKGDYSDAICNVDLNFPKLFAYAQKRDQEDGGDSHYYENLFWEFYMEKERELVSYWNDNSAPMTVMLSDVDEPEHAEVEVLSPQFQDVLVGKYGHHVVKTEESLIRTIDILSAEQESSLPYWDVDENGNWVWFNDDMDVMALTANYDYSSLKDSNGQVMPDSIVDDNLALFEVTLANSIQLIELLIQANDNNIATVNYVKQLMADTKIEEFMVWLDKN
ncbi:TPA: hypothetical protein VBM32_002089 [Streptococcus agalactiae]|nr:hypothetical protein [Streptococcus agalactiae]